MNAIREKILKEFNTLIDSFSLGYKAHSIDRYNYWVKADRLGYCPYAEDIEARRANLKNGGAFHAIIGRMKLLGGTIEDLQANIPEVAQALFRHSFMGNIPRIGLEDKGNGPVIHEGAYLPFCDLAKKTQNEWITLATSMLNILKDNQVTNTDSFDKIIGPTQNIGPIGFLNQGDYHQRDSNQSIGNNSQWKHLSHPFHLR